MKINGVLNFALGILLVRFVIKKFKFGKFLFVWEFNSGSFPGGENIVFVVKPINFTRIFYFDDANETHIVNFCRKFAFNKEYRRKCIEGTVPWAHLSNLYELNVRYIEKSYERRYGGRFYVNTPDYLHRKFMENCRDLYYFLKSHLGIIIKHPKYRIAFQQKRIHDSQMPVGIDPLIKPVIIKLNKIPDVKTAFSCQGVSSWIRIENTTIFLPDGHELYAYVQFEEIPEDFKSYLIKELKNEALWNEYWRRIEAKNPKQNRVFIKKLAEVIETYQNFK